MGMPDRDKLELDAADYGGDGRFYEVEIRAGRSRRRFGVVAEDELDALEEAIAFADEFDGDGWAVRVCPSVKLVTVAYESHQDAPKGIFHGGTSECHPAFAMERKEHGIDVAARAAAWVHLFERNDELPMILYVSEIE